METLQEVDEAWDPDNDEDRVLQGVVGGEFMCCQRQSKTPMLQQKTISSCFGTILIASWSSCGQAFPYFQEFQAIPKCDRSKRSLNMFVRVVVEPLVQFVVLICL